MSRMHMPLRKILRKTAAKVAGTLCAPSASPVHQLADLGLFLLILAALAIVLAGMLLGPVAGLVTPEL